MFEVYKVWINRITLLNVHILNTCHGGGVIQSNVLHEMFEWFYHGIIDSSMKREKALQTQLGQAIHDANISMKQVSWKASPVVERVKQWVAIRVCFEKRWIQAPT